MSNLDDIDGLSDRQIARKTYEKLCEVDGRVEKIEERVSANEDVTEPIRRIAGSTWDKLVYSLGWGILALIALLLLYGFKVIKALKHIKNGF